MVEIRPGDIKILDQDQVELDLSQNNLQITPRELYTTMDNPQLERTIPHTQPTVAEAYADSPTLRVSVKKTYLGSKNNLNNNGNNEPSSPERRLVK